MEEVKRMDKYIIKASGNINEVLTALRTLQAVYGGMTLTEIDKAIRYGQIHTAINRQFQGGKQ
jgi:hypothetical protein